VRIVALIPARAGSKRIAGKNTRLLGGKPLIAWTIEAANQSGVFEDIVVCSDCQSVLAVAVECGVYAFPRQSSADDEPDIAWVRAVSGLELYDAFAILRPTSPFRCADTIRHAWAKFIALQPADSLRSTRPVTEHPGKVWMCQREQRIVPLLPYWTRTGTKELDTPWHSTPTQCLPAMSVQTAGLEIAWTATVTRTGTIAGTNIIPYRLEGMESLDINTQDDWERAERYLAALQAPTAAE
jgi:CMP-N,N'-diacetyllegionaminic acid synthase